MRVLALMGSGETSPTMVTVHRALAARLGPGADAVLLDTPYGFQENVHTISRRARAYFADSVGLAVRLGEPEDVRRAGWVFAGPGSPTYAMRRWAEDGVADALRERVLAGPGVTVLASAAACTAGARTLPVYEIYKAGADPHWQPGLELLPLLGLPATVVPHYDNAEGGTHDTRFCYLGERRLAPLERQLPAGGAVLGVDEHTALVLDLDVGTAAVHGRGGVTVRRHGDSTVLPAGSTVGLEVLRSALTGTGSAPLLAAAPVPEPRAEGTAMLGDVAAACRAAFEAAAAGRDGAGMARAVLELEAAIETWSGDMEEDDQEANAARPLLRGLVGRLAAAAGAAEEERRRWDGLVEDVAAIRADLRRTGQFAVADELRRALARAGVHVADDREGSRWRRVSGPA